jgi:hypothetical protein
MQLWPYRESDCFESAIHDDLHLLLHSFFTSSTPASSFSSSSHASIHLTFCSFKRTYKDLFFHELHNFCPLRIHEDIFFQQIIHHILILFHHPSPDIEILTQFPIELRQALWNIGVFFLLYCFYGTRSDQNHQKKFRIRVSPEEWYELILAYERLKSLGKIGLQAIKIFHKLQADSAFHFSSYSGGPSLSRISKMIEDIRLKKRHSRSDFPQYLQGIIEGNELVSSQSEEMRSLVFNDSHRFTFPTSWTPLDAALLRSDLVSHTANMDESMKDFFGFSDGNGDNDKDAGYSHNVVFDGSEDSPCEQTVSKSRSFARNSKAPSSTLSLLEQLERETGEVLGLSSQEVSGNRKKTATKKARTTAPRKKAQTVPPAARSSLEDSSENDPLRLLEQLEQDSRELLGTDRSDTDPKPAKSRKRNPKGSESVKTKPRSKADTKSIASDILMQLEAEVSEVFGEVAAPKLNTKTKAPRTKKTMDTKKAPGRGRKHQESQSKSEAEDPSRGTTGTENDTLSLLEQLERETMEVLSGGEEIE